MSNQPFPDQIDMMSEHELRVELRTVVAQNIRLKSRGIEDMKFEIERLTTEGALAKEYGKVCDSEAVLAEAEIARLAAEGGRKDEALRECARLAEKILDDTEAYDEWAGDIVGAAYKALRAPESGTPASSIQTEKPGE